MRRILLLLLVALIGVVHAEHWAVIVAGSRGYDNYRHQADACHAYHVARRHGLPRENVILMMYNDAANATENPFPGRLYNREAEKNAVDVYADCHVDYVGDDVTPENFLHVLEGNATATKGKKVLESGPNDRVFINFVDHGARGFVVFPHGEMLTSHALTTTLERMFKQKKYQELVFYVEACHAGSMFWSWSMSHIHAFVTTAANGWESSWGTYCPPHDTVQGVALGTCLGDLYSVSWMEDSDKTDLSAESLEQQYRLVQRETKSKSHVQQFGSSHIRREIVGDFLSNYDRSDSVVEESSLAEKEPTAVTSAVDAHDIPLVLRFYRYLRSPVGPERAHAAVALTEVIDERGHADAIFQSLRDTFQSMYGEELRVSNASSEQSPCHTRVFETFGCVVNAAFGRAQAPDMPLGFSSYSLQYAGILTDLCDRLEALDAVDAVLQQAFLNPQNLVVSDLLTQVHTTTAIVEAAAIATASVDGETVVAAFVGAGDGAGIGTLLAASRNGLAVDSRAATVGNPCIQDRLHWTHARGRVAECAVLWRTQVGELKEGNTYYIGDECDVIGNNLPSEFRDEEDIESEDEDYKRRKKKNRTGPFEDPEAAWDGFFAEDFGQWTSLGVDFRPSQFAFLREVQQDETLLDTKWPVSESAFSLFSDLVTLQQFVRPDETFQTDSDGEQFVTPVLLRRLDADVTEGIDYGILKHCGFIPPSCVALGKEQDADTGDSDESEEEEYYDYYDYATPEEQDIFPRCYDARDFVSLRRLVYVKMDDWRRVHVHYDEYAGPVFYVGRNKTSGRWLGFVGTSDYIRYLWRPDDHTP